MLKIAIIMKIKEDNRIYEFIHFKDNRNCENVYRSLSFYNWRAKNFRCDRQAGISDIFLFTQRRVHLYKKFKEIYGETANFCTDISDSVNYI